MACKPKGLVEANSKGWFQGTISKEIGFKITNENTSTKAIIGALPLIDLDNLADFLSKENKTLIKKQLNLKIKALKTQVKKKRRRI